MEQCQDTEILPALLIVSYNKQVKVQHMGPRSRVFKVKSLTAEGASRLEFDDPNGNRISVADYFKAKYNRQ